MKGRELLLRAARDLMTEKGLPQVTGREIAERAGVGSALVNYYFGNKSGLFSAIIEQLAEETRTRLDQVLAGTEGTRQRLRHFVREIARAMQDDPYLPRLMMEHVLFADEHEQAIDHFTREFAAPNLASLGRLLIEGEQNGELRKVDPMLVVPALVGACVYFFLAIPVIRRLFDFRGLTPELVERYADSTADLILQGLTAVEPTA